MSPRAVACLSKVYPAEIPSESRPTLLIYIIDASYKPASTPIMLRYEGSRIVTVFSIVVSFRCTRKLSSVTS